MEFFKINEIGDLWLLFRHAREFSSYGWFWRAMGTIFFLGWSILLGILHLTVSQKRLKAKLHICTQYSIYLTGACGFGAFWILNFQTVKLMSQGRFLTAIPLMVFSLILYLCDYVIALWTPSPFETSPWFFVFTKIIWSFFV